MSVIFSGDGFLSESCAAAWLVQGTGKSRSSSSTATAGQRRPRETGPLEQIASMHERVPLWAEIAASGHTRSRRRRQTNSLTPRHQRASVKKIFARVTLIPMLRVGTQAGTQSVPASIGVSCFALSCISSRAWFIVLRTINHAREEIS